MESWIKGMGVSTLLEVEECGGRFADHGVPGDALKILKDYGTNLIRLRLWNDPYTDAGEPYGAGTCDLPRTMVLARRAKALGIDWMLDIQYSDFWTDPGKRVGMAANPSSLENIPYPLTHEGQCQFMADLMETIRQVPEGRGKGFVYWEPAWLPVPGSEWANEKRRAYIQEARPGGNEWANQSLFDYDGNALPALALIRDFRAE